MGKMSDLNSIILEGIIVEKFFEDEDDGPICYFWVASHRMGREEEAPVDLRVQIRVTGPLAKTCDQYLKNGNSVRVVGRIEMTNEMRKIRIYGEHVEFKTRPQIEQEAS